MHCHFISSKSKSTLKISKVILSCFSSYLNALLKEYPSSDIATWSQKVQENNENVLQLIPCEDMDISENSEDEDLRWKLPLVKAFGKWYESQIDTSSDSKLMEYFGEQEVLSIIRRLYNLFFFNHACKSDNWTQDSSIFRRCCDAARQKWP
eukprot:Gregarina_sp_Poly_1__5145@NODE_2723_length_1783_cov_11_129953_g1683_i1_p1_GENE_NODE_2723_length_1783_cov_11_129953_g1683_i1NODE_2723_length_1783_cov_11_129953_g1683_i1_p1_ORF_typecomplete_len151_score14_64_NODE_2723_length_1783_cov_11_129953_g1683_i1517969